MKNLEKRLQKLENSAPIIDNLAAYVLWVSHGCPPGVRWDKKFRRQIRSFYFKARRGDIMKLAASTNQYCTYRRHLYGACQGRE